MTNSLDTLADAKLRRIRNRFLIPLGISIAIIVVSLAYMGQSSKGSAGIDAIEPYLDQLLARGDFIEASKMLEALRGREIVADFWIYRKDSADEFPLVGSGEWRKNGWLATEGWRGLHWEETRELGHHRLAYTTKIPFLLISIISVLTSVIVYTGILLVHGELTSFAENIKMPLRDFSAAISKVDVESPTFEFKPAIADLRDSSKTIVMLLEKLTSLKSKAENASRNEAIANTTQMFAHDVRKPFTLIQGLLGLLEASKSLDAAQSLVRQFSPEVRKSIVSVNGMINDIMEVGSSNPANLRSVELDEIVLSSIKEVFGFETNAPIDFEISLNHELRILADRIKVGRVFSNILANAFQAMNGKGKIWIKSERVKAGDRPFAQVRMGNTNSHIEEADIPELFDAFYTKNKEGGTGLGLAIAKKIVLAHGGEIGCTSSFEKGVEFSFTIPLDQNSKSSPSVLFPQSPKDLENRA